MEQQQQQLELEGKGKGKGVAGEMEGRGVKVIQFGPGRGPEMWEVCCHLSSELSL